MIEGERREEEKNWPFENGIVVVHWRIDVVVVRLSALGVIQELRGPNFHHPFSLEWTIVSIFVVNWRIDVVVDRLALSRGRGPNFTQFRPPQPSSGQFGFSFLFFVFCFTAWKYLKLEILIVFLDCKAKRKKKKKMVLLVFGRIFGVAVCLWFKVTFIRARQNWLCFYSLI